MNRWHVAVFAVAMLCGGAFAGESEHSEALLDRLAGNWVLSGRLAGRETTHDIAADWALNRGYLRIHELSREKVPSGAASYEAIVFISCNAQTDDYTCLWLDSTSNQGLVAEGFAQAKRSANSLPFVFRDANGQVSFENTFVYDPTSGSWEWIMDNVEAGRRKPFGRVTLVQSATRAKDLPNKTSEQTVSGKAADSDELAQIYREDQADRTVEPGKTIDWNIVSPRDEAREIRVKEMITSRALKTGTDYYHAAMVLQHAVSPDDYLLAHDLCVIAIGKGESDAKWLAAASLDRFLVSIGRLQQFGTQYGCKRMNKPMHLEPFDPDVPDSIREELNVPSIEEAKKREAKMIDEFNERRRSNRSPQPAPGADH